VLTANHFGVLYPAFDESSYMSGSELVIDGGWGAAVAVGLDYPLLPQLTDLVGVVAQVE
jgi:outer membrane protein W